MVDNLPDIPNCFFKVQFIIFNQFASFTPSLLHAKALLIINNFMNRTYSSELPCVTWLISANRSLVTLSRDIPRDRNVLFPNTRWLLITLWTVPILQSYPVVFERHSRRQHMHCYDDSNIREDSLWVILDMQVHCSFILFYHS